MYLPLALGGSPATVSRWSVGVRVERVSGGPLCLALSAALCKRTLTALNWFLFVFDSQGARRRPSWPRTRARERVVLPTTAGQRHLGSPALTPRPRSRTTLVRLCGLLLHVCVHIHSAAVTLWATVWAVLVFLVRYLFSGCHRGSFPYSCPCCWCFLCRSAI